jgi:hypothetical protein
MKKIERFTPYRPDNKDRRRPVELPSLPPKVELPSFREGFKGHFNEDKDTSDFYHINIKPVSIYIQPVDIYIQPVKVYPSSCISLEERKDYKSEFPWFFDKQGFKGDIERLSMLPSKPRFKDDKRFKNLKEEITIYYGISEATLQRYLNEQRKINEREKMINEQRKLNEITKS